MRVVAGTAGGRRLHAPPGDRTRPTTDRVREAVFNVLFARHRVEGTMVLDLFAGSGAMGIEALSRGAERAILVDDDRRAIEVARRNLDELGMADRATVLRRDVLAHLGGEQSAAFDLVVADPPYEFGRWSELLGALPRWLAPDAVVVAESDRPVDPTTALRMLAENRSGGTVVTFLRGTAASRERQE